MAYLDIPVPRIKTQDEIDDEVIGALAKIGAPSTIDSINDFIRRRMDEDGMLRRIMPPIQVGGELADQWPDRPIKILDHT